MGTNLPSDYPFVDLRLREHLGSRVPAFEYFRAPLERHRTLRYAQLPETKSHLIFVNF
jgi:hypothetical protein